MKKIYYLWMFLLMVFSSVLYAQNTKSTVDKLSAYAHKDTLEGWKHSGLVGLTFGQTSLSKWAAGGENSTITGNFTLNVSANYLKGEWFWDNNLLVEYGMIYASSTDWQKAADKLNVNSIGGRKISEKWAVAGMLNFNTQFTKGYKYPNRNNYISTLFAPAYLDAALGFSYRPSPKYRFFLSPIAEREIFVLDDSLSNAGALGVDKGKKVDFETGAYVIGNTNQTITANLSLISSTYLFTPYNEKFGNFDVVWDLLLTYKLNRYFTASLNTTLRYYEDEIKAIQSKEIFGLGITYTF
jgi:hypothetical protein